MDDVLPFLGILAVFAVVVAGFGWLAARARRRGVGGSMVAIADEVFRPTAHRSRIVIEAREEQAAPAPSPGEN